MKRDVKVSAKPSKGRTARMSLRIELEYPNHDPEAAARAGDLIGKMLAAVMTREESLPLLAQLEAERRKLDPQ